MANPWLAGSGARGEDYDRRFADLDAGGVDVHGEAAFVQRLGARSILDAGCGTGRVAIELARRGHDVVGVDLDPTMLAAAAKKAPDLVWCQADLAEVDLGRTFDAVVMAGNVMIFLTPGDEAAVVANLVRHLRPGGLLVAGFSLRRGGLGLDAYDEMAATAGLRPVQRYATWDEDPFTGGDYAVSVHRRPGAPRG